MGNLRIHAFKKLEIQSFWMFEIVGLFPFVLLPKGIQRLKKDLNHRAILIAVLLAFGLRLLVFTCGSLPIRFLLFSEVVNCGSLIPCSLVNYLLLIVNDLQCVV